MIPEGENKNADQWIGVMYSDATAVDLYNFGIDLLITLHQYSRKHINGLVHDCSNSSALAMELLQSCTISLIQYHITKYYFNYNVNSKVNIIRTANTIKCQRPTSSVVKRMESYLLHNNSFGLIILVSC